MSIDRGTVQFFLDGAVASRDNAAHWFRYLRKIVKGKNDFVLTQEELSWLLSRDELSCFQKVTLKRAMTIGTPTYQYVKSLNEKWTPTFWPELLRRMKDATQGNASVTQ